MLKSSRFVPGRPGGVTANDLLIHAIREAGLDIVEVADVAGADPRTVQRWLGGRVPHPRYRQKLAAALQIDEQDLWPETVRVRRKAALNEITAAGARRGDADAPDWRALLRAAADQIDMLGYSLHHITQARQIDKLLTSKAGDGCAVRIAIASPDSNAMLAADAAERPPGRLAARIRSSQATLLRLAGHAGIEVREHQVTTSHTVLRFDDTMLLTIHLYGTPGFQAPVFQLRRESDYGIFDQLAGHFEEIWQEALPLGSGLGDRAPVVTDVKRRADDEKQRFLDGLDQVYRPPA